MKNILVIDDDGELADRIERILSPPLFKLYISNNYNDALRIAERYLPALILIIQNGKKEEPEYLKKISEKDVLSLIPLIVITKEFSAEDYRMIMEAGADDYIPEEFIEKSLLQSVNRRLSKLSQLEQKIHSSINTFDEYEGPNRKNDHILVKVGNKLKLIEFTEIVCITALKEYSKIITSENYKIIVRKSLKSWVKLLPSKFFLRIHRATIINISFIEEITKTSERTYTVRLKKITETFDFSHRYANIMRRTFPK